MDRSATKVREMSWNFTMPREWQTDGCADSLKVASFHYAVSTWSDIMLACLHLLRYAFYHTHTGPTAVPGPPKWSAVTIKTVVCTCCLAAVILCAGYLVRLYLWPPCVADVDIIFLPCGFYLSIFLFSLPNLSGRRLDVYHTSTHGWP